MRGWKKAFEGAVPDNTREVIMADASRSDTFSAQYVAESKTWYKSNTNDRVASPLLWREFPDHPAILE